MKWVVGMPKKKVKNLRQEQAAETRRNLLDAAQKLFANHGYNATSVRSISKEIGAADGLLYHYFPGGKKEILQAVVMENFMQIFSSLKVRPESLDHLTLEEALEYVCQRWYAVFEEYKYVIKILFKENEVMGLVEYEKIFQFAQRDELWFEEFLRRRAEKGEIREIDYKSATQVARTILLNNFFFILMGVGLGPLSDAEYRKRLIAYQVGLWKP
jgi:AcrR family transcriptional regulator